MNKKNATDNPLSTEPLSKIDAYWRAANYLSVCRTLDFAFEKEHDYENKKSLKRILSRR
jgi:phosphoketolase